MEETTKKNPHGGAREGAGRKRKSVHTYTVYATQEVYDIIEKVQGSKSDFICQCILDYQKRQ